MRRFMGEAGRPRTSRMDIRGRFCQSSEQSSDPALQDRERDRYFTTGLEHWTIKFGPSRRSIPGITEIACCRLSFSQPRPPKCKGPSSSVDCLYDKLPLRSHARDTVVTGRRYWICCWICLFMAFWVFLLLFDSFSSSKNTLDL